MNFFKKMWNGIFAPSSSLTLQSPVGWTAPSSSGLVVSDASLLGLSTAWRCISLLSGTIASLPITLYRENSKGIPEKYTQHSLYNVLKIDPNADQTAFDFWHFLSSSLEMRGNAYARITRNSINQIVALTPINPACISERGKRMARSNTVGRKMVNITTAVMTLFSISEDLVATHWAGFHL